MIVTNIAKHNAHEYQPEHDMVHTLWMDNRGEVRAKEFGPWVLVKVED